MPECSQWKAAQMRRRSNHDDDKAKHVCSPQCVARHTSKHVTKCMIYCLPSAGLWAKVGTYVLFTDLSRCLEQCLVYSSAQFSRSVVSDSVQPHELQHARPPCPSPTPRVYPNSCPLRRWCHLAISSSVIPFSSCLQSFPASGSFQMSQLFASDGQNIGVSASTSVLPMNTRDWFPSHKYLFNE